MTNTIALVISILIQIESGGVANAVGDDGRAVGILQMWPISVREANRIVGKDLWTSKDRSDPQLSLAMAKVTLGYHYNRGVTDPIKLAGRWRNPHGNAPRWYLNKARKAKERIESSGSK